MNQEKIGKFISKCRKDKNITQEELAEKLNVSNKSVSRWENGKNMPDYSILNDLCNILDININELLSGEKDNEETIENLDMILKEYYKMKKQKEKLKKIIIIGTVLLSQILLFVLTIVILNYEYDNRLHQTTNLKDYNDVIGPKAKGIYENKWDMSEEIFPKKLNGKVEYFKMLCDDFWDKQFLSYLVIDYNEEDYNKEIERLEKLGIEEYNYYGVTGFTNYKLVAMNSDHYNGFIYALTDGKSKVIYVELIFCNYTMDLDYENEMPKEYLPDGFNAKQNNLYEIEMMNKGH
ncbi:MAG: helix-turn-helix transcriptional regulator [Bacilli bacterium]|nr:helix-turn-helix transcriptional regulator [Bacilli bacterium]